MGWGCGLVLKWKSTWWLFSARRFFLLGETMSGWQDPVLWDDGASTDMTISVCLEAKGRKKRKESESPQHHRQTPLSAGQSDKQHWTTHVTSYRHRGSWVFQRGLPVYPPARARIHLWRPPHPQSCSPVTVVGHRTVGRRRLKCLNVIINGTSDSLGPRQLNFSPYDRKTQLLWIS